MMSARSAAALLVFLIGLSAPAARAAPAAAHGQGSPLRLAAALATARAHQPQLRLARSQVAAAQARADLARASLWPQVGLNGNLGFGSGRSNVGQLLGSPSAVGGSYGASANVEQLVYDFNQTPNRYHAAELQADAQSRSAAATDLQIALNVRLAFFNAVAARTLAAVAGDTLANQLRHLNQIRNFVAIGRNAPIDLAQTAKDVANARVARINARNAFEVGKAQLNQAMGIEGPTDYDVADDTMAPVAGEGRPLAALLLEAETHRPELMALADQVRAQGLLVRASAASGSPKIAATGALGVNAGGDRAIADWSSGLNVSWPLYAGGAYVAQTAEARATLAGLQAQADTLRQQVRLALEQARLSVTAEQAAVQAAVESTRNGRVQLDLAEGRYAAGVGSVIELGDAQVAYSQARAQEVQERYKLAIARAQLLQALGRP